MSYKHGDWHCNPKNGKEALEIINMALLSGAKSERDYWCGTARTYGVYDGMLKSGIESGNKYTIAELRQKFPLPGEQVEEPVQWRGPEDWLPPVGWHGECNWLKNKEWFECVALPGGKVAHKHRHSESWVIGDYGLLEFRPLRTEREKWIDAALSLDCEPNQGMLSLKDFVGAMYDALQSGQLKAPEVSDAK